MTAKPSKQSAGRLDLVRGELPGCALRLKTIYCHWWMMTFAASLRRSRPCKERKSGAPRPLFGVGQIKGRATRRSFCKSCRPDQCGGEEESDFKGFRSRIEPVQ